MGRERKKVVVERKRWRMVVVRCTREAVRGGVSRREVLRPRERRRSLVCVRAGLKDWLFAGKSEEERDARWEAQKAVLRDRKSGGDKRIRAADARRREVSKKIKEEKEEREQIKKDWLNGKAPKKMLKNQYEDVPEGGIPLPMASFGMPKFDYGERFDLAAPFTDEGWVAEDADVMKR